jgi:hypothetical protein
MALPPEDRPDAGPRKELPRQFRRTLVDYSTNEPVGTIVIDTPNTYLYLVLGHGKALRYGIGVGREGFTWFGAEKISRMAEWPDWNPPEQMIKRQPYLPRFMAGGDGNPLGARALYLGDTLYRIHGTNQPSTIGSFVSSGCIRLTNEDITDLYGRVKVGTRVGGVVRQRARDGDGRLAQRRGGGDAGSHTISFEHADEAPQTAEEAGAGKYQRISARRGQHGAGHRASGDRQGGTRRLRGVRFLNYQMPARRDHRWFRYAAAARVPTAPGAGQRPYSIAP